MAIIQPPLDIPTDIAVRIATGELVRRGGVVRNASTGRLVKLLDDANPVKQAQDALQASAAKAQSFPRTTVVVVGTVAVLAVAGAVVWGWNQRPSKPSIDMSESDLQSSLTAYLAAAREGRLDVGVIQRAIASIDAVSVTHSPEQADATLSLDDPEALVQVVADYTRRLEQANDLDPEPDVDAPDPTQDALSRLRHYLELQQRIFANAA